MTSTGRAIALVIRLMSPVLIVFGAVMRSHLSCGDPGNDCDHVLGLTGGETRYLDRQIEMISTFEAWLALGVYAPSYAVFHCIRPGGLIGFAVFWRATLRCDYRITTRPLGIDGR